MRRGGPVSADFEHHEYDPPIDWSEKLRGPLGVVVVAFAAGVAAAVFAARHDLMFLYADARSHLTISRRLIDGPNHGIVQLGTVWLPLPHLAVAWLSANDALWRSGWAAVPVGVGSLAIEATAIFSIVRGLVRSRLAGWVAVLLFLSNPSILYLHTTALTEPVLFAAMLTTVASLVRWASVSKPYSGGEIAVFCGLPATAAVLSRYDGWAFVAVATVAVFFVAWRRWGDVRYALRLTRSFAVLPTLAALWWFWFNWVNFGDALEFQRGRYSAQAQQEILAAEGRLPDKGDMLRSVATYSSSVLRASGWLLLALALAGVVIFAVRQWRDRGRVEMAVPWLLLLVPFGFYVMSLFTGQVALRVRASPTESIFNLRYGVEMLLGAAVFGGIAADALRRTLSRRLAGWSGRREPFFAVGWMAFAVLLMVQTLGWGGWRDVGVVEEGFGQRAAGAELYAAAEWMHDHATSGTILIDDSINPMLPVIAAPLGRVAAPFSGDRWVDALADPTLVEWIYVDTGNPFDEVGRALAQRPTFGDEFVLRFESGVARVYQRADEVE